MLIIVRGQTYRVSLEDCVNGASQGITIRP
jgi:hypothetical protein